MDLERCSESEQRWAGVVEPGRVATVLVSFSLLLFLFFFLPGAGGVTSLCFRRAEGAGLNARLDKAHPFPAELRSPLYLNYGDADPDGNLPDRFALPFAAGTPRNGLGFDPTTVPSNFDIVIDRVFLRARRPCSSCHAVCQPYNVPCLVPVLPGARCFRVPIRACKFGGRSGITF